MGLTNKDTLKEIQKLFDWFFYGNSVLDRIVYQLDIKFNQPTFQDYVHHSLSHKFPVLADNLQGFGSLRGDMFFRGAVPIANKEYGLVSETMEDFVMLIAEAEKFCSICIDKAISSNDKSYEDFLRDFNFTKLAPLMKQAIVFYNATKDYEKYNDIHKWDKDFSSFIIKVED